MEMLAAARLLADTDVVGTGFENAGFVITGSPPQAVAVKIDPGFSFNWTGPENKLNQTSNPLAGPELKLEDRRDLQCGNLDTVFKWSALTEKQKDVFITSLKDGLMLLTQKKMQ